MVNAQRAERARRVSEAFTKIIQKYENEERHTMADAVRKAFMLIPSNVLADIYTYIRKA